MSFPLEEYASVVETFRDRLLGTDESIARIRLSDDAWSLIEIVGHLIDSAANNHQRFVRLQTKNLEDFPGYEGETWIGLQSYSTEDWKRTVELWYLLNRHLLHVIEHIDVAKLENYWILDGKKLTLEWLVRDYFRHLNSHVEHFERRTGEILNRKTTVE